LFYTTSKDGVSWTSYNVGVETGTTPSIVTNGTHAFYVRYEGVDSGSGEDIMFRVGTLHTDGTIAWQPENLAVYGIPNTFFYGFSLRISTTGQAFFAYQTASSSFGSGYPHVIHSNGLDYSIWQQNTQLSTSSDEWHESLVALPSGQMYILYWPYWGGLRGRLYSSGAWGPEEIVTPSNTYVQQTAFGFTTGASTVYAIYQERTSQNLRFVTRTTSWSSPQTIAVVDTGTNARWSASYDSLQNKFHIVYYNSTTNQIYEWSGNSGNWSGKTQLFNTSMATSSMGIGTYYNTAPINSKVYTLGIFWLEGATTNYNLKFGNENLHN
jgi:hypothetical protein